MHNATRRAIFKCCQVKTCNVWLVRLVAINVKAMTSCWQTSTQFANPALLDLNYTNRSFVFPNRRRVNASSLISSVLKSQQQQPFTTASFGSVQLDARTVINTPKSATTVRPTWNLSRTPVSIPVMTISTMIKKPTSVSPVPPTVGTACPVAPVPHVTKAPPSSIIDARCLIAGTRRIGHCKVASADNQEKPLIQTDPSASMQSNGGSTTTMGANKAFISIPL